MQALLGSMDTGKLSDVYKWVTGMESYLLRLCEQPEQDEVRALVLGSSYGDFGIVTGGIGSDWPARGVRIAPQSSTGSNG